MRYTIDFVDDLMCLIDDDGDGHDAFLLGAAQPDAARQQLAAWAKTYPLDLPRQLDRLEQQLRDMTEEEVER
ncbi:MAG TPA: hypothetical protein VGN72_10680 [Tepidisphaeraceae bacterium]|jgi:hypothetical protein|nr:hypothetical protein [Tepidisphaeraceae bacterium]